MGSGIEVIEEGERTRVLMPESVRARLEPRSWVVAGALVVLVVMMGFSVWTMMGLWTRAPVFVSFLVVPAVVLMPGFVRMPIARGVVGPTFFRKRVELVVDRRGVGQVAWGPFCLWRVRLKRASWVMVCPPLLSWPERNETGVLATVRMVGRKSWLGYVWGAYEQGVAEDAAVILREQVERVRRRAGVSGPEIVIRNGMVGGLAKGRAEETLETCGVRVERGAEGVRMRAAMMPKISREDRGLLVLPGRELLWVLVVVFGAMMGGLGAQLLGGRGSALYHAGEVISLGFFLFPLVALRTARMTFSVGPGGITRKGRVWGMGSARRWGREEIEAVYVRRQEQGGWYAGIRVRGGKQVDLAMGWRWTVEAFAEVVERELGMGEREGGVDHLGGGSG